MNDENMRYSDVEEEDTSTIAIIEKPFDPKKINIITKQMTLDFILKRLWNDEVVSYTPKTGDLQYRPWSTIYRSGLYTNTQEE